MRCLRVECHSDYDCASNQACLDNHCVNPCTVNNICAQNAICFAINHAAYCKCPEDIPSGNPFSYCERLPLLPPEPECKSDPDCPSKMACVNNKCVNPCIELSPCANTAHCSVLDSVPVRTMVCECPEMHVPDVNGECRAIKVQIPTPSCISDSECPDNEACINRQCRNPCNCGINAQCTIQNHRAICSCDEGFEGNPYTSCRAVGCRIDRECESGKACVNGNCINPCLINDPCGTNAECFTVNNKANCRCLSGYRGNPYERCTIIGCRTNSDCPSDKACVNQQCVNPCMYDNPCSVHAECRPQNHIAVCKCPVGFYGNPYVDCRLEERPECVYDTDCPSKLACLDKKCQDPCLILEPCSRPARCEVQPSIPLRTMICICPEGYISSGSGTCKPTAPIIGGCIADSDCSVDKACVNGICRDPCNCGLNAECRIKDHKPVCSCKQGYEGNPEFECIRIGCRADDECSPQHSCINRQCVPVCEGDGIPCGRQAECYGINHRAVCECRPGFSGNPRINCVPLECQSNDDCPLNKACINNKCQNPCEVTAVCAIDEVCKVYQHQPECACPPGFIATKTGGCRIEVFPICTYDSDCPTQTACIGGECVNPCNATQPCGVNANCRVVDTVPVRTMICECLEGYQGNAAIQCDKRSLCHIEKGFVRDIDGNCVCPPGTALDIYEYCIPCAPEKGYKIDETGHCICDLERGLIIDINNHCICPEDMGYRLTERGECVLVERPECKVDDDCADSKYCNIQKGICEDACINKVCGIQAFCNATRHIGICQCIRGYKGIPEIQCNRTQIGRDEFQRPEIDVKCLADGVEVHMNWTERKENFTSVLYVKGHSKEEECRKIINFSGTGDEIFKVYFGSCGLIHINGVAAFILVLQPHPKLVTYDAQAYNIRCVYQTGERNVTLGFNVSMLTTAGTIANTGPPPICQMRIVTHNGQEINSAEIGDNLMLQVDVEPASKYSITL